MDVSACMDHGKVGTGKGYAQRSVGNRMRYMHRLAYAASTGMDELTMGGVVMHACDNPRCINPEHLVLGTHKDNTKDMLSKGRSNPPAGTRSATAKLTEAQVREIREANWGTQKQIAARYGIGQDAVSRIKGGKRWQHLN